MKSLENLRMSPVGRVVTLAIFAFATAKLLQTSFQCRTCSKHNQATPSKDVWNTDGSVQPQSNGDYGFGEHYTATGVDLRVPGLGQGGIAGSSSDPGTYGAKIRRGDVVPRVGK